MTIDLHVLVTEEDGVHNATCLEMGLATAGPEIEVVERDMVELIGAHIAACLQAGRPQDIFVAAPPEYWLTYAQAVSEGHCRKKRLARPAARRSPADKLTSRLAISSLECGIPCAAPA